MDDFELINRIANETNTNDFQIYSYDGVILKIVGSFDHCYYHEVEVIFEEVEFIILPQSFSYPTFRFANENEKIELKKQFYDMRGEIYCIESDDEKYFIAAARMEIDEKKVLYEMENDYPREVR